MASITIVEKKVLFKQVRTQLGFPYRDIDELDDDTLDTLFSIAIEDYGSLVQDWAINQQWSNLQGAEIDATNFVQAFTTKSLDYERNFAFAYGKQTGIGTNSPWELKRDSIEIISGQQVYEIPAGREVNEVLWCTPPVIGSGSVGAGSGGGGEVDTFSAGTAGWSYGGQMATAILPTYGLMLSAQDASQKRKLLQSEMSYKIVGGANGTKNLFLYPIPGSRDEIRGRMGKNHTGSLVWYWYYDTNSMGRDKCLEMNQDIILLPDEAPLANTPWSRLNNVGRTRVRKILSAHASLTLGKIRGTYKGELAAFGDGQAKSMDYGMFMAEGKQLMEDVSKEIMASLEKLRAVTVMRERAEISEALNKTLSYQPHRVPFKLF